MFPIDVARDAATLRRRHQGGARILIAPCVVRLSYGRPWDRKKLQFTGPARLRGVVQGLEVNEIHVPLPYSRVLDPIRRGLAPDELAGPRYAVTLCYGTRGEPWVRDCRRLPPVGQ